MSYRGSDKMKFSRRREKACAETRTEKVLEFSGRNALALLLVSTIAVFSYGCSNSDKDQNKDDKNLAVGAVIPVAKSLPTSPKYLEFNEQKQKTYFNRLRETPSPSDEMDSRGKSKVKKLANGLKYIDIEEGWGISPQKGGYTLVHYTGWLENGKCFDSSLNNRIPFEFIYGEGKVIVGLEQGIADMKVGGTRKLIIPPNLAYGNVGLQGKIPPNATVIYQIKLLSAGKG